MARVCVGVPVLSSAARRQLCVVFSGWHLELASPIHGSVAVTQPCGLSQCSQLPLNLSPTLLAQTLGSWAAFLQTAAERIQIRTVLRAKSIVLFRSVLEVLFCLCFPHC